MNVRRTVSRTENSLLFILCLFGKSSCMFLAALAAVLQAQGQILSWLCLLELCNSLRQEGGSDHGPLKVPAGRGFGQFGG